MNIRHSFSFLNPGPRSVMALRVANREKTACGIGKPHSVIILDVNTERTPSEEMLMGKQLVFVGGGHAHMTALLNIADFLKKGHRAILISPTPYHYYSGMGPGLLSGIYEPREVRFHIRKMVEDRGATFIEEKVARVDPEDRKLILESGRRVHYDIVSFNTGSEVPVERLTTPDERIVPVKPIINLYKARGSILKEIHNGRLSILVAGGGPAGVEIAANVWRLVHDNGGSAQVTLIAGERVLSGFPSRARSLVLDSLAARRIEIIEGIRVDYLEGRNAILSDGRTVPYGYAFVAVGVKPTALFRDSAIPVGRDGGLLVNRYLRSVAHGELFGGGDCISIEGHDLARVGVHAVRQNSILHHNLMAALEGGEMTAFTPHPGYMLILNMGDGKGVLWKKGLVWDGRISFILKDFVDKRFMRKFQVSGELSEPFSG